MSSPESGRQTSQSSNEFRFFYLETVDRITNAVLSIYHLPATYNVRAGIHLHGLPNTPTTVSYCRRSAVSGKPLSISSSEAIKADPTAGGWWVRRFRVTARCPHSAATACRPVGGARSAYHDSR